MATISKAKKTKGSKDKYGKQLVHADITLKSKSGQSIHEKGAKINQKTIHEYLPPNGMAEHVLVVLKELGFQIISSSRITICVAAPYEKFQKIFDVKLDTKSFYPYIVPKSQRVPDEKGCGVDITYKGGKKLPILKNLEGLVDAIHLSIPAYFCASATPPDPDYFHLKIPYDVARLVDAVQCHNKGVTGNGVRLAMPDQGTFDHPYYTAQGYNITLDESAYDDTADTGSHGTAIAANALAIAPGVDFIGIRNGKKISSATAAFNQAVSHNPNVITISWGTTSDVPDLRASIVLAVNDGITICCACGNGGTLVFPSSMPEIISVGGAYANETDHLQASTYASSGSMAFDAGRQMPDVVGLVGQEPKGIYITLPCHDGSDEDSHFGGGTFPDGDETTTSDGWLVASGTSSATPQVAAVACLLIEHDPATYLGNPAAIKQRLIETAVDVTTGTSANSDTAINGVDNATGSGIVDAFVALNSVDVWIRDNSNDSGLVRSLGAHWVSPDIKVCTATLANPDAGFDGAIHESRPAYGTDYYIYIKARNRGVTPATNVTVSFHYADPGTFSVYPNDWMDGQSGVAGKGVVTVDGVATNNFFIDSIPAKGARVAGPFIWSPPIPTGATQIETEADGRKRGHYCLLARLDCVADPITYTGGAQSTVWLDNNLGMKNLWVIEPELITPLMLVSKGMWEYFKGRIEKQTVVVDCSKLPKGYMFNFQIPKKAINKGSLEKIQYSEEKAQRGLLRIYVKGGDNIHLDLLSYGVLGIKCWVDEIQKKAVSIRPISRELPHVDISHYVQGKLIGGARFAIGRKSSKNNK